MKYYLIAGEASGDLHGSNLLRELSKLDAEASFRCWGGEKMQEAGGDIVRNYADHNYMGFVEVLTHLPKILGNIKFCKEDISNFNPDVIILIDFPGFNLRIAKWAKEKGYKVVYYISPQIWAWKTSRVYTIKKCVDVMLVILPFEEQFYTKFNYKVFYVGHPLLDNIKETELQNKQANNHHKTIALLPGSRLQEVKRMLPVMLEIVNEYPLCKFVIAGVSNIPEVVYSKIIQNRNVEIIYGKTYQLLNQADAAIVTSGTATLEVALFNVPQVVCYKSNRISYLIAKALIKVSYISLVNLILNREAIKELIQCDLNKEQLNSEFEKICFDNEHRNIIFANYDLLRRQLNKKGASANAANHIINALS